MSATPRKVGEQNYSLRRCGQRLIHNKLQGAKLDPQAYGETGGHTFPPLCQLWCFLFSFFSYLVSSGQLEVIYDDAPLTLAECHSLLLQATDLVQPDTASRTYASLRHHGLTVMRPSLFHTLYKRRTMITQLQHMVTTTPAAKKRKYDSDSSSIVTMSASSSIPNLFYAVPPLPRPIAKKVRRSKKRIEASITNVEDMNRSKRLEMEAARLKEMQSWLKLEVDRQSTTEDEGDNCDVSVGGKYDGQAPVLNGLSTTAASLSSPLSPMSHPDSSSSPSFLDLSSTLLLPCDFFYVWFPDGQSPIGDKKAKTFKKSDPPLPDFVCIPTKSEIQL